MGDLLSAGARTRSSIRGPHQASGCCTTVGGRGSVETAVAPPLPPAPGPRKSRKGLWIGLGVVGLLLVIGIANSGKNTTSSSSSAVPTVAVQPAASPAAPAVAPAPAAPSGPATEIGQGTYQVGVDIAPGRYKTAGPGGNGPLDI